jgi:hypothetical protein
MGMINRANLIAMTVLGLACSSGPGTTQDVAQDVGLTELMVTDVVTDSVLFDSTDSLQSDQAPDLAVDTPPDLPDEVSPDLVDEVDSNPDLSEVQVCNCEPPSVSVTVNEIPKDMNGSIPFTNNAGEVEEFHLALPTFGFVLNATFDCPCGCDPAGLTVQASEAAGDLEAESNLFALMSEGKDGVYTIEIGEMNSFTATTDLTFSALAVDVCGQSSQWDSLTVETMERTAMLDPFDLEDPWLIVHHRDHYSISLVLDGGGSAHLESTAGPNGIDDFMEDLWTVGLGTANPTDSFAAHVCGDFEGGSTCLARMLLERIRKKAYAPFGCPETGPPGPGCVSVRLYIEGDPEAPHAEDFEYQFLTGDEQTKNFSMMGIGGGDITESWVGMSESMDERNVQNENNATKFYGCFTTRLFLLFYEYIDKDPTLYALAQTALADILPSMDGVPLGELPGDELIVDFNISKSDLPPEYQMRRVTVDTMIEILATGLAALLVHEMGHSLGLVPKGAPPYGLFAAEKEASFIENPKGSVGPHVDTAGPNLMQAGPGSGNMDGLDLQMLFTPFFFNPLNMAYLRRQILVL